MLAIQTENVAEVSCVILPLREVQLILPASCVAEVLPWRAPTPLADVPPWCAGALNWHGVVIPAVDLETLESSAAADPLRAGRCLAVLNRTSAETVCPFYALVVCGIPRLVQLAQVDLAAERGPEVPGELLRVRVGTELLVIPDLAHLERHVMRMTSEAA